MMNNNANLIRSAANGMNKTIIRPATNGLNTAASEMNKTIIRPTTNGLRTVATGMNNTIIRPSLEPIIKLRNLVIVFKDTQETGSPKSSDDGAGSKDSESQSELSDSEPEPEEEPIPESAFQYLIVDDRVDTEALNTAIHEMYSQHVATMHDERYDHEEDDNQFAIRTTIAVSTILVNEFALITTDNQGVLETIQQAVADYVFPRISLMYTDASQLRASEVAKLISFADLYNETMTEKGLSVCKDQLADFEDLATEYLRRAVHDQMKIMVTNSLELRTEEELRLNDEGNIVTGNPDDVNFMMTMQLSVARDNLPPRFLSEVLTACNHELENMVGDLMIDVGSNWKQRSIQQLCAAVNDAAMLIQQCEDLNESILDKSNSAHVESGDDLLRNLTELSLHAVRFVCESIMLDVREPDPILTRVGSPAWEQQSEPYIKNTIMTLDDYFRDVHSLISEDYYFPKVLKNCFDMTIQTYVDSFFANTMAKGIKDPLVVSQELLQDWQTLNHFFCIKEDQAEYFGHAGHYSKEEASHRLDVIQALSFLMTPGMTPSKLDTQIKTMLHHFGTENGVLALLHIAGLRIKQMTSSQAGEWHTVTQEAVEEFVGEQTFKANPPFTLPDLRDSKYIARMRGINKELDESLRSFGLDNLPRPGIRQRWGNFRASRRLMKSDRTLLSTWKTTREDENGELNVIPEGEPENTEIIQES